MNKKLIDEKVRLDAMRGDLFERFEGYREKTTALIKNLSPREVVRLDEFIDYNRLREIAIDIHEIDAKLRVIEYLEKSD